MSRAGTAPAGRWRARERTTAAGDSSVTEDQAHIEVELTTGEKLARFVERSLGNVHRPLTDAQLDEKFRDQALLALPLNTPLRASAPTAADQKLMARVRSMAA